VPGSQRYTIYTHLLYGVLRTLDRERPEWLSPGHGRTGPGW